MKVLNNQFYPRQARPIRILQFGEGNFLRAFVDDFISQLNEKTEFNGNVCVVQPRQGGRVKDLMRQDGLYTLLLEGIQQGKLIQKKKIIDVIQEGIDPYIDWDLLMEKAADPLCQIIISNTTEAGIVYHPEEVDTCSCPISFPAKIYAILKKRYETFHGNKNSGMWIICCELIENNGGTLKDIVCRKAKEQNDADEFIQWIQHSNYFYNTLVDRIVPGYPKNEINKIQNQLHYLDQFIVKSEIYHSWILQGDSSIIEHFPITELNCNILLSSDLSRYRQRKVSILNGMHTSMVPLGILLNKSTVQECVLDETVHKFLENFLQYEVWPSLNFSLDSLKSYSDDIFERFKNPRLCHELQSISLNSISKFNTRILPTAIHYYQSNNKIPLYSLFSFSALIICAGEYNIISDESNIMNCWKKWNYSYPEDTVKTLLNLPLWKDKFSIIPNVEKIILHMIRSIKEYGLIAAINMEVLYE